MYKFEQPGEIEKYAQVLRELGGKCSSTEAIAMDAVSYLYNRFGEDGPNHHCALMRFFRTIAYSDLTPYLQDKVKEQLGTEPPPSTNCLTLLATRGIEPEWNDRQASRSHQVIPLVSEQMIVEAPMIAQLIQTLGIDVANVVEPVPGIFLKPKDKKYHTMYVGEAKSTRAIVSQKDFVIPFGIRSVIGFGGLLPTGDMFAAIMFMRVFVSAEVAERCGLMAAAVESSINELRSGKKSSARILIAADSGDIGRFLRLLKGTHNVINVDSLELAKSLVEKEKFDLILCGTNFDESRMFDLLAAIKQNRQERRKPFICFSQLAGFKSEATISKAAAMKGATCYLESDKMSDAELLNVLQAYLPEEIWQVQK
jgi:CheY-like chemotaxis protein